MDTFFHNILSTVLKSLYREKTRAIFSMEVIFQHVYWIFGKTLRCPENRFPSLYSKTNKLFKDTHRQKHYLQIRLQRMTMDICVFGTSNQFHCVKSVPILGFFWSAFSNRIQESTHQKKLRIWTLFTQCSL